MLFIHHSLPIILIRQRKCVSIAYATLAQELECFLSLDKSVIPEDRPYVWATMVTTAENVLSYNEENASMSDSCHGTAPHPASHLGS